MIIKLEQRKFVKIRCLECIDSNRTPQPYYLYNPLAQHLDPNLLMFFECISNPYAPTLCKRNICHKPAQNYSIDSFQSCIKLHFLCEECRIHFNIELEP